MALLDELEKMNSSELEALKQRTLKQQEAQTIGTAAASLAPGLIGLLTGGTDEFRAKQFERGNQIAESAGKQHMDNQKNLKEVMLDGQPRYVTGQEALYEQPYKAPVKQGADMLRQYAPREMINTITKKVTRGLVTSNGVFDEVTGEKLGPEYRFYQKPNIKNITDLQGTGKIIAIDPVTLDPSIAHTNPGLGTVYDTTTKGQAENIEDIQKKATTDVYEINKQIGRLEQIENELNTTKDPRVAGSIAYGLARDIEPRGVLTDNDVVRILGMDRMTFLDRFDQAVAANITGDIEKYTRSFKELVKAIKSAKRKEVENIQGIIPKGGPKSKAPKGEQVAPSKKPSNEAKAKYIEFEKQAKLMMKDPKMIKMFLDKKKSELGL